MEKFKLIWEVSKLTTYESRDEKGAAPTPHRREEDRNVMREVNPIVAVGAEVVWR